MAATSSKFLNAFEDAEPGSRWSMEALFHCLGRPWPPPVGGYSSFETSDSLVTTTSFSTVGSEGKLISENDDILIDGKGFIVLDKIPIHHHHQGLPVIPISSTEETLTFNTASISSTGDSDDSTSQ